MRYTARGRPQIWQRRRKRVEYLGFCFAFAIFDVLAMVVVGDQWSVRDWLRRPFFALRIFIFSFERETQGP